MRNFIVQNEQLIDKIYDIFTLKTTIFRRKKDNLDLNLKNLKAYLNEREYQVIENANLETRLVEAFFDLNHEELENHEKTNSIMEKIKNNKKYYHEKILEKGNNHKQLNILDLYNMFIDYAVYIEDDSNNSFSEFEYFLSHSNCLKVKTNKKFREYFEIFRKVNHYQYFYKTNYLKFKNLLSHNRDKFVFEVIKYKEYTDLFEKIQNIHESYNNNSIEKIIGDSLAKRFNEKNIRDIDGMKKVSQFELYNIIESKDNIDNIVKKITELDRPVSEIYFKKVEYLFINYIKPVELEIIEARSKGSTLESLGKKHNVTRERIRQIESKIKKKLIPNILKLDYYLKIFARDKQILTSDELSIMSKEKAQIIKYIHPKYMEELDIINFNSDEQEITDIMNDFKSGKKYLHEEKIDKYIEEVRIRFATSISHKILKMMFHQNYQKEGSYYYNATLSLVDKYEIILKYHFDDFEGLGNETVEYFKQRYHEVFDDKSIFEKSNRSVIARAIDNENILLLGKGLYGYKKSELDKIEDSLYQELFDMIDKYETMYVESLYEQFKDKFNGKIDNRFELHGLLKRRFKNLYFTKDYVSIKKNPTIELNSIVHEYLEKNNGILSIEGFINSNPRLIGLNIEQWINNQSEFIPMFDKNYIHKEYIEISKNEKELVKEELNSAFSKQRAITGEMALNIMNSLDLDFMRKNNVRSNVYAYHIVKNYIDQSYYYDYPFIYQEKPERSENSFYTKNQYVIEKVFSKDLVSINEIQKYAEELSIRIPNMKEYLEYFYENGYLRLEDQSIARKNRVFTNAAYKYLERIEEIFIPIVESGHEVFLSKINLEELPGEIKWNIHLLAHLIINLSRRLTVITIGNQYNALDYQIRRKKQ